MRTKIYHVVFKSVGSEAKEFFCTNRKCLHTIVCDQLKNNIKVCTLDNYIQKKSWLPVGLTYLETYDTYEFLSDIAYKHYGTSLQNLCSKSIQCKYTELIKVLCNEPNPKLFM